MNEEELEEILEEIYEIVSNPTIKCNTALEKVIELLEEIFEDDIEEPDIDDPEEKGDDNEKNYYSRCEKKRHFRRL